MNRAHNDARPGWCNGGEWSRRTFVTSVGAVFSLSIAGASARGADGDAEGDEAKQRLADMRRLAQRVKLVEHDDPASSRTVPLREEPLHRYGNRSFGILDGTLWAWGERGRPVGTLKVELWPDRDDGRGRWSFGVCAVSAKTVAVEFRDGLTWSSRAPGLELQDVPETPAAADTPAKRLLQAKELWRRLSAHAESPRLPNGLELRLLPTPVHRYADPDAGLLDGIVFAFVAATNPETLVFYELWSRGTGAPAWRCGCARQGTNAVTVRDRGTIACSIPYAPPPSNTETYMNRSLPKGAEKP